jgi:TonB family protein
MSEGIKFFGFFGVSLAIHMSLFIVMPYHALTKAIQPLKPIEVSYKQSIAVTRQPQEPAKNQAIGMIPSLPQKKISADFIKNEIFKEKQTLDAAYEPLHKQGPGSLKKNVSLPNIPGETFKTPEYKSYYQLIREKIRRFAYYNYRKLQEGEVFLTFSLTPDGELADVAINEQKSSKDDYLRNTALNSIREAAPFGDFPEKLKKNQKLSFNVIISFEVK